MRKPTQSLYKGMPVAMLEFQDISEFVDAFGATTKKKHWGDSFCGNMTMGQACYTARNGDERLAGRAKTLTDSLGIELEMPSPHWLPAVAGAFPNVPAFLAGEHEAMMLLTDEDDDRTPVRIWVSTSSSYDVTSQELERRGSAILALVMLLIQTRPVELYVYHEGDGEDCQNSWATAIVKVNTAPLHLGQAAFMLCSQGFGRGLMYHFPANTEGMGYHGRWMFGVHDSAKREAIARELLGAKKSDLIIPGAYSGDRSTRDPEGWLRDHVAKFTETL